MTWRDGPWVDIVQAGFVGMQFVVFAAGFHVGKG